MIGPSAGPLDGAEFISKWRYGPDLAGAYMEPDEFVKYLRGRLREHFIADIHVHVFLRHEGALADLSVLPIAA